MANRPKVFVSRKIPDAGLDQILAECDAEVWPDQMPPTAEQLLEKAQGCAGLITLLTDRIDAELLDQLPDLKVVSNFAVGYNNIDVEACTARGISVGNTPDVLTEATADTAVALMLAAARRVVQAANDVKAGLWKTWEPMGWLGQDLAGKTLGIVGMGRIGAAVAKRMRFGWGMKILYTARQSKPEAEQAFGAIHTNLGTLLRESDFVSIHASLTPESAGMLNAEELGKMKPTAVLVNTSRGQLIDQAALAEALRTRRLFAAGLDVTDPEPLPLEHELHNLQNCLIVPHIASATQQARDAMALKCAANLLAGVKGEPLPDWVNPEVVGD